MSEKKNSGGMLEAFFAGKGFYIVLFLCVAVIGISAWIMLAGTGTDVEQIANAEDAADVRLPQETEAVVVSEEPPSEDTGRAEPEEPVMESAEAPVTEVWHEIEPQSPADYFIWPVAGEIEVPYSVTALLYDRTMRDWRTHDGIDIAAALGAQVMAAGSGIVTSVRTDNLFGVTVEITHANGLVSTYSNLAELPTVQEGDGVMVGEVIGAVGNTAICESGEVYHLHFGMKKDGNSVNPEDYLPDR